MPGMIMLWYGTVASIPSGWHECDGTMGTPDMRDRFVRGLEPPFNFGDLHGTESHKHTFTGDGHTHSIPNTLACPGAAANLCLNGTDTGSTPAVGETGYTSHTPKCIELPWIMKL